MAKEQAKNFEGRMDRLQEIVTLLEEGEISLADSVKLYKEGLELCSRCKEEIEKAKHEIKILQNDEPENFESGINHAFQASDNIFADSE